MGSRATQPRNRYIPASYAGEESVTFPNGLIIKMNNTNYTGDPQTVTFAVPFPNAAISVSVRGVTAAGTPVTPLLRSFNANGFTMKLYDFVVDSYSWIAIGY